MQNISCIFSLNQEYPECPGRYCGRKLLDEISCSLSECQVNLSIFSLFNSIKIEYFY